MLRPQFESDSFTERLEILREELTLAIRFDRPSILFAIYSSLTIRKSAEAWIKDRIGALDQGVIDLRVTRDRDDIPTLIYDHPSRERVVFSISDLSRGGGKGRRNAYRALNLRREHFVEHPARMIFWLTRAEAKTLPRYAPDFWAFRHRVVEFFDQPDPVETNAILMRGSNDKNSAAYWNNAGNEHFALGMPDGALAAYRKAIRIDAHCFEAHHNLGLLFAEMNRWEDSAKVLRKALRITPNTSASLIALAQAYDRMDRSAQARSIREKMSSQEKR
jgi:tetratricopeptide (TPR) repeat protein